MVMQTALSVSQLSFTYQAWNGEACEPLFQDLSFTVEQGSKTLVLAPFNKGKSTLAKIICGVCPKYFPGTLAGSIALFGKDLAAMESWDLLEDCGYVSQNPQEQFIANSVEEELAFPLESLGLDPQQMHVRIERALHLWGLHHLRTSSEQELSGGERKRVLLAVLQALDPKLWLLDEAFDDLDQNWKDRLKATIAEPGRTVLVLASRYLEHFDDVFDQVLLLDEKRIVRLERTQLLTRFFHLCGDDLPNPLAEQHCTIARQRSLSCSSLQVERKRVSTSESNIFSLEVPSFSVSSGELVTLVGPNGSGKSSFSRLLCGLDDPVSGSISIDEKTESGKDLSTKVGYLFQNPDLQIFLPTVAEELSWSLKRRKDIGVRELTERVEACARLFGLNLSDTPSTMSYPLRKALQAAVYYLLERPFYILDELDAALTYQSALMIISHLRERGAGIVLITHDRQFASKVGQRGYTIVEGRLEVL
jgi:energy-coupling factor transport system ATP-binding protein